MSRIIPIFIPHLGCPHDCVFCNQKRIAGTACAPTPSEVRSIVAKGLSVSPGAQVAFYGGSFTAIETALQDEYLAAARDAASIRVSTRGDAVDEKTVARLVNAGVRVVELGAQSMNDEVLKASGRGHTAEDTYRAAQCVTAGGMSLVLQMMVGLPGDTRERAIATAHTIAELAPDAVRIYPTVVVRDTALADMLEDGRYSPLGIDEAISLCAEILEVFDNAKIPVIRLGLNPTHELEGSVVAGPYHPAFGQMVRARMYLEKAKKLLHGYPEDVPITLYVNPKEVSNMAGHRADNRRALAPRKIKILPNDTVNVGDIIIERQKL
ncbi:MAG: radical SAM protein [Clostridia bacterium]